MIRKMNRISGSARRLLPLILTLVVLMMPAIATAQLQFVGTVKDETGAVLPGVLVFVSAEGFERTTVTNGDGQFTIDLAAGQYDIRLVLSGFTTIEEKAIDITDAALTRDFIMRLAPLEETIIVSASKIETQLINAPATVSVISSSTIASSAANDYGDLLRAVPGVNVIQTSARDINITSRQPTSTLATSQLALLDGRTIYQDFFGFILWDFLPTDMSEVKQIEVIRGPASAVWGANAQTGVVNIITKPPREIVGAAIKLTGGAFSRDVLQPGLLPQETDPGTSFGAAITFAQAVTDNLAYKVSGSYYEQDPLARPRGIVPIDPDRGTGGGVYPPFINQGTQQPKFDFRLDHQLENGSSFIYGAGTAGTEGIIHTGIGPFDIQSGSLYSYGKVNFQKNDLRINFFANILDGDAVNLLTVGVDGRPLDFFFDTKTYDIEVGHSALIGDHQLMTYGGNYRRNNFDLSLAPLGDNRNEGGAYFQDEIFVGDFRFVLGARVDRFDVLDDAVFSPRVTAMYKPTTQHALRVSFNRAFRAPSLVNNFLDVNIISAVLPLGLIDPRLAPAVFPIVTGAFGNPDLTEESLDAFEIGYTGNFDRTFLSFAYYINDVKDSINFTNPPGAVYTSANPPPGWPLSPIVIDILASQGIVFPSFFTYLNLGPVRNKGLELSVDQTINQWASVSVNYSWQDDPEIQDDPNPFPESELIFPPTHRFNAAVNMNSSRYLGSFSVNYADEAFWTDVLDARFHGATDEYAMVNASFGVKWREGDVITSIKLNNITNADVQQHVFGDIIKRSFVGEVRISF